MHIYHAALNLIRSNGDLTIRGHAILNAAIAALLRDGLVDYAPSRRIAYRLTAAGLAAL